jgi:UDP-N-acetylmuramoyl-tripeptide--D-alanyl-D-alanine ligase
VLGAAAVIGVALSPLTPVVALVASVALAVGPFGFPLRPRAPGPMVWTARLRTVAAVTAGAQVVVAAAAIALGAGPPVVAAIALVAPLTVDAALAALKPVEDHRAGTFVDRARERLRAVEPTVVAITGSYGKTTTKVYAAHLMAAARRVVPSPRSFNNRAGLSRAVNEHLTPGTEVFIAEMGTYGRGEIAELVEWLRPEVSAITAIGPVHLERFGSEDEIVHAKSEIFTGARTAVLNVDNARLADLADRLSGIAVVRCSSLDPAADVSAVEEGGRLVLRRAGEVVGDAPVPDAPLENIAVAAALAFAVGVPPAAVAAALATLPPVPNRQALERLSTGALAVDDTFNSNPVGCRAALTTLCRHATEGAKRVVVTPGMVELGPVQARENRAWGALAARAATDLVLVGLTNRRSLLAGAAEVPADERAHVVVVDRHEHAVAWVRANTANGDVVLYENQLPDHYP